MAIKFNNGIVNVKGTPGVITDTLANRPNANTVLIGTVFFSTDNNVIYQVHTIGAIQGWAVMGGGGGGTQNLDNVLYQGGQFTSDRTSNLNNYGWELQNIDYFNINTFSQNNWSFTTNSLKFYGNVIDYVNNLFSIDYTSGECTFGDFSGQFNGTHMNVNVSGHNIYFAPDGYGSLLVESLKCKLGDYAFIVNGTQLLVDDSSKVINMNFGSHNYFNANTLSSFIYFGIGDFNNDINGTSIQLNDEEQRITLSMGQLELNRIGTSPTSSGNSGEHLVIFIDGTEYKIKLENP